MDNKKIVVAYDHSPDARLAVAWALDHAGRVGAPVTLLYAHEVPTWIPSTVVPEGETDLPGGDWKQAVLTGLEEIVAAAKRTHPTVPAEIRVAHEPPAQALVERSAGAGMVVLGSRGHSAVTSLLGSVSTTVSAHAGCPVVVVRGPAEPSTPVVAGVDSSAAEWPVLRFAAQQAASRGVPLRVVRAGRPPAGRRREAAAPGRTATAGRHTLDEAVLRCRYKFPGVVVVAETVAEHPAVALTAESGTAQLLVVGSRGRGAIRGLLLGSVSQHLLRHSACSVAVVHTAQD
jgi:nucleotide-binding universal stress UspA family protein